MEFSLWVATLGAVAEPARGASCADAIGIRASAKDSREMRGLLRRGSLSGLRADSCRDYQVRLLRNDGQGWTVSMTSRSSTRKFEREVKQLTYAATWVEAWAQSGFAPTGDDSGSDSNSPVPSPGTSVTSGAPSPAEILLGVGPLVAVTSREYGFLGASLLAGYPARRTPWFGLDLGVATQLGTSGDDYRRAYWAGPMVGASMALSDRWHLRPALALGFMGSAVRVSSKTASAASLYAGMSADVSFDVTARLALSAGVDARLLFENFAGSSSGAVTQTDDDGEVSTTTNSTTSSSLGQVWGALRFGVEWHFGDGS